METDLESQAKKLRQQGTRILEESGIIKMLENYGPVRLAGSYLLDTMVRPDLDLFSIRETHDRELARQTFQKIYDLDYFQEVSYVDGIKFKTLASPGMYFQAWVNIEGTNWKIDINLMDEKEEKEDAHNRSDKFKDIIANSPEKRYLILEIKQAMREGFKYVGGVDGKMIYRAVLENGVSGVEEFKEFMEKMENKIRDYKFTLLSKEFKTIYFVRHGESVDNAAAIANGGQWYPQDPSGQLTALGIQQAEFLGKRLSRVDMDTIISSPYERAKKTAEIINKSLNKRLEFSDLLIEVIPPVGVKKENGFAYWTYPAEDTFEDRKNRSKEIISMLEQRPEKHILVVSHGGTLAALLAYMMLREELTPFVYEQWVALRYQDNTGITVCKYLIKEDRWKLKTWNDLSHLE